MMKLYQEYKINPMSGCLPMLIQMPIILILYQAIYKPLTCMFGPSHGFTPEVIKALVDNIYRAPRQGGYGNQRFFILGQAYRRFRP